MTSITIAGQTVTRTQAQLELFDVQARVVVEGADGLSVSAPIRNPTTQIVVELPSNARTTLTLELSRLSCESGRESLPCDGFFRADSRMVIAESSQTIDPQINTNVFFEFEERDFADTDNDGAADLSEIIQGTSPDLNETCDVDCGAALCCVRNSVASCVDSGELDFDIQRCGHCGRGCNSGEVCVEGVCEAQLRTPGVRIPCDIADQLPSAISSSDDRFAVFTDPGGPAPLVSVYRLLNSGFLRDVTPPLPPEARTPMQLEGAWLFIADPSVGARGGVLAYSRGANGDWSLNQTLEGSSSLDFVDAAPGQFGVAIKAVDDCLAVTSLETVAQGSEALTGAVYMFERDDSTNEWIVTARVPSTLPADDDDTRVFGETVDITGCSVGDTLLVGGENFAQLFRRSQSGTYLEGTMFAVPDLSIDFGFSVAIDTFSVLVGAPGLPVTRVAEAPRNSAGAVFRYDSEASEPVETIFDPSPLSWGRFGHRIATTGSNIFVSGFTGLELGTRSTGTPAWRFDDVGLPEVRAFDVSDGRLITTGGSSSSCEIFVFDEF